MEITGHCSLETIKKRLTQWEEQELNMVFEIRVNIMSISTLFSKTTNWGRSNQLLSRHLLRTFLKTFRNSNGKLGPVRFSWECSLIVICLICLISLQIFSCLDWQQRVIVNGCLKTCDCAAVCPFRVQNRTMTVLFPLFLTIVMIIAWWWIFNISEITSQRGEH